MKYKVVNFRADRISGWFYDPAQAEGRRPLDLLVDGEPVAAVPCNIFREELPEEEFSTRNVGFVTTLPPQLWTGQSYSVALRERSEGRVLHEKTLSAPDRRFSADPDLIGDFNISELGQIAGWVSYQGGRCWVRIYVDGQRVCARKADAPTIAWSEGELAIAAPRGYAFSYQLPGEHFDDEEHLVETVVVSPKGVVTAAQCRVKLSSEHQEWAEEESERVSAGRRDWRPPWKKASKIRHDIRVEKFELTSSYARVALSGPVKNKRVILRLGSSAVALRALESTTQQGARSYAAEIPMAKRLSAALPRWDKGSELEDTYDLRLGEAAGSRPSGLPDTLTDDHPGELAFSGVRLEAGQLGGFAFHTGDLDTSLSIVLSEVTGNGTEELFRVRAASGDEDAAILHGVQQTGGYTVPLPLDELLDRPVNLMLTAEHEGVAHELWRVEQFLLTQDWVLTQALETPNRRSATALIVRARRAGLDTAVESFLSQYKAAASELTLRDLEVAIADYRRDSESDSLAPSSGALWYWVEELRNNRGRLQWFTQNAIRNRTGDAKDVLAYAATKGRHDFAQLHGLLESTRAQLFTAEATERIMRNSWRSALLCLARFLYSAPRDETDWLDALTLYSLVHEHRGLESVRTTDRAYYGDLLVWRRRYEDARNVLDTEDFDPQHDYSQRVLALNTLNPALNSSADSSGWWAQFNTVLTDGGAEPVSADATDVSFFSLPTCLAHRASTGESEGPLVSVIMPIYEPSTATDVAVASLLGQTWGNLEIIMIDDASPSETADGTATGYRHRLERLAEQDSRIRLIFNTENRGSYSVRNEALDLARGEFFTVADKDDWHHPQQIEIQARQLVNDPELIANETNWARVDANLKFIMRSATGRVVYPSLPSLMFRREPVLRDLGYWDTVRKSGDSEFKSRMENYYGFKIEPVTSAPLALALMEGGNLTANDMGAGYLAPDRRAYLRAYKRWHRSIREDDASPYMPKTLDKRPFVAPPAYLPQRSLDVPSYDVVFASEFGFLAGNSTSLFNEISVCLEAGLKVGVIPLQNGLIPSAAKRQFNQRIDELIFDGRVDRLSLDTEAVTDLLVIRWPTAVQIVRDSPAALRAGRIVIVSNHPPYEPSGERRSYDIGVVTRNVERIFGRRPLWAPQSEQIGAMLEPLLPASDLADCSWKGIIRLKDEHISRNRFDPSRCPVIGRHARDDTAKWPSDREVFRQVYPVDGSVDVCILGGARVPMRKGYLPRSAENWEIYAFNEIEVDQYLSQRIDFFVYFHSDGWLEAFGMAILEAMSYGVVCVLPYHFEPVFKEAAVYAAPEDSLSVVKNLWGEAQYAAQQARARRFIERECTPNAYLERLASLGVGIER
ncbi:glycosyltransferase [Nesterenkonia alkaliphila]|uniref:Glycosyltransferase n=1 Tax=Nesterenkonia alkaliphila TaxID=1463631 RepID=A0A7K1UHE5_9MICC|nr:glycosyltransferase [Nesterenkonia alkaliphila]MVT25826.1 glycosyltransferase [Nesterenkonia alkaliphila]GFZ98593.1 hypothetical protein GCM10011359_29640 [Nesterenkonia alkaliphila]